MEATKRPWVVIDELKQVNAIGIYDSSVKILICELRDPENKKDEERMQVNASLIVRAVNTFDQAREALKELIGDLDDYWNQQNDDCSPVSSATIVRARQALAAMEAEHT